MAEEKHINLDEIAQLARLQLTEEKRKFLADQLEQIFSYVDRIRQVDVEAVEPSAHAFAIYNVWGEDEVESSFPVDVALANSPASVDDQIAVPRVVEES